MFWVGKTNLHERQDHDAATCDCCCHCSWLFPFLAAPGQLNNGDFVVPLTVLKLVEEFMSFNKLNFACYIREKQYWAENSERKKQGISRSFSRGCREGERNRSV